MKCFVRTHNPFFSSLLALLLSNIIAPQAGLIAHGVNEGRRDELRRAALHARWMESQDRREQAQVLHALKHGHRRRRRQEAGLNDEDDDVSNAKHACCGCVSFLSYVHIPMHHFGDSLVAKAVAVAAKVVVILLHGW
jgi:hypothetical protein